MKELLLYSQKYPMKIKLPNNNNELLVTELDEIEEKSDSEILFHIKLKNSDKFKVFTENILKFYVKKHLSTQMKLFSLEKEFDVNFTEK